MVQDNVPDRPHWVISDLTDPEKIDWVPRNTRWKDILVPHRLEDKKKALGDRMNDVVYLARLQLLNDVRIFQRVPEVRADRAPHDPVEAKARMRTGAGQGEEISEFTGAERPLWMDKKDPEAANAKPAPDGAVYSSSPGATVFNAICLTCHGPRADSRGLMAETLADMTGGATRVANLRETGCWVWAPTATEASI